MEVNRATRDRSRPSGATIRNLTGDTSGGTNLSQVQYVDIRYYGHTPRLFQPIAWTDILGLSQDRGFILQLGYGPIADSSHDCFRNRFRDNHSIWINNRDATGFIGADPGADGRYPGCPSGYQHYSFSLLRAAAGKLDLSGLGTSAYRPLGAGKAYILLAPKDPPVVADPVAFVRTVKVVKDRLTVRGRPRVDSKQIATLSRGQTRKTTKLMRHGGAYTAGGKRRTDWLGYTRAGRTVWIKRAFTKVV